MRGKFHSSTILLKKYGVIMHPTHIQEEEKTIHPPLLCLLYSASPTLPAVLCQPYSASPTLLALLCQLYCVSPTLPALLCQPYSVSPTLPALLCQPYSASPTNPPLAALIILLYKTRQCALAARLTLVLAQLTLSASIESACANLLFSSVIYLAIYKW